jgi:hypothetical protein
MKPPKISIPRLTDHSDKLAGLLKRREELGAESSANFARQIEIGDEFRAGPAPIPPSDNSADARVRSLLGELAPPPVAENPDLMSEYHLLVARRRDLEAARELLDRQIDVERRKASAAIRELVRPEYRARVRAVCDALRQVHNANASLAQMCTALRDSGVEWTALGVVAPKALGAPTDSYSPLGRYFLDALEAGFITRSEIPEGLRR